MKNYILLFFAALSVRCSTTGVQVTFDDEKSNAIRAHYQNYLNNDMEGLKSLWSPDIEMFLNNSGSPALIKDPGDFDSIFVVMPMKG